MVTTISRQNIATTGNQQVKIASDQKLGIGSVNLPYPAAWLRLANCNIEAQISGTATSATAVVQRSDYDPDQTGYNNNAVNLDAGVSAVNLSTGAQAPLVYYEYGVGWYRWVLTSFSGGTVNLSIMGQSD